MEDFQGIHFGFCVQQVPKGETVTIKGHILSLKLKKILRSTDLLTYKKHSIQ